MPHTVGRVYVFPKDPPLRINCANCAYLLKMIRDHKRDKAAARSFAEESVFDNKLWAVLDEL